MAMYSQGSVLLQQVGVALDSLRYALSPLMARPRPNPHVTPQQPRIDLPEFMKDLTSFDALRILPSRELALQPIPVSVIPTSRHLHPRIRLASSPFSTPLATLFRTSSISSSVRHMSTASRHDSYLFRLQQNANAMPSNAAVQAKFYAACLDKGHPEAVVERYETAGVARDDECTELYLRAREEAPESPFGILGGGRGKAGPSKTGGSRYGTEDKPIHVQVTSSPLDSVMSFLKSALGLLFFGGMAFTVINMARAQLGEGRGTKMLQPDDPAVPKVRFSDVQGVDEAKEDLQEVVEFLRNPMKFTALGGKLPKGVLLKGPPGTGKTMLAKAVAGEAGVPFISTSGSEFEEMFVGLGAKRIRDLFSQAKKNAPCIIFIDELDAVGGSRDDKQSWSNNQTLNQLLVELDGFDSNENIVIIGATNFAKKLDPALVRPGRFDRHVVVPLPDVRGRVAVLRHYAKNVILHPQVNLELIARGTSGMSGADLVNLINTAAVRASREGALAVNLNHMEWAKDKILMGAERRTKVSTEAQKLATAYHEGGHAMMAIYAEKAMPLYKATIMPRGEALGITFSLPDMDKDSFSKTEYISQIDVAMGGRVAEELVYGKENVTSGASSDIANATNVAKAMVTQWGFSDKVGPVRWTGGDYEQLSMETKQVIESEIRMMIEASEARARRILTEKRDELDRLAHALVQYETLTAEEIRTVMKGGRISKQYPSTL
ncbi:i-AAA protease yme1 [Saitoella coloradoensis]